KRRGAPNAALWGALAVILLLCAVAVLAPLLAPYAPSAQLDIVGLKSRAPSLAHPFGTDRYSRDVLSRVIYGARISLSVATLAVLLSATLGTAYGVVAGYVGGRLDGAMMRLLDAFLAIPRVLLLVAVLSLWSPVPLPWLILVIGLTGWFEVSRLVRAEVLSAKQRDYVTAARALGASNLRIVVRHVLPNVLTPVIVAATLGVANVIILEAGLSYLGIGAREPTASWGSIFFDGSDAFEATWWVALFPGLAILCTVLAFNVLGDALRDLLDPHQVD
ncbi:MAG TPA: ABC transporter permease, partial [Gemmatimonadaceae bacterium]|nr:ABC transporter permease [Gemmatimonadaceae bacterium]